MKVEGDAIYVKLNDREETLPSDEYAHMGNSFPEKEERVQCSFFFFYFFAQRFMAKTSR